MRHRKSVRKLGVTRPHRRAMLSNLANSLIDQGKIKTTTARAKVLQSDVERLVTLAKKGDVHSRRQALRVLRHRTTVKKLFEEIAPEFKNMNGGFTRRAYFGRRLGDGASLSVIELNIEKKFVEEPKKKGKRKSSAEKSTAKTEDAAEKPKKKRAFRKKKKAD
jgi:large subunit ribosomal protein L17